MAAIGRPKNIKSPEQLWQLFLEYKKWAKATPYQKQDFVGKDAYEVIRKLERPLTWIRFEVYCFERGIVYDLGDYEKNKDGGYTAYSPIIRVIKAIIEADQFEGASVGIYQHNIIARKLGLADKQEARATDKDGNDVQQNIKVTLKL